MTSQSEDLNRKENYFLPITRKEIEYLGWDYVDVILISGDAYVDHPSFAAAVIGRVLEQLFCRSPIGVMTFETSRNWELRVCFLV